MGKGSENLVQLLYYSFIRIEDNITLLFSFSRARVLTTTTKFSHNLLQAATSIPADTTSVLGYSCLCYGVSNWVQLCFWPLHGPLLFRNNRIEY